LVFRARWHGAQGRTAGGRLLGLLKTETNYAVRIDDARLIGAFEHFYKNNRFGNSDYGTHYVVLGYELKVPGAIEPKADDQHSELRWWPQPNYWLRPGYIKTPRSISRTEATIASGVIFFIVP